MICPSCNHENRAEIYFCEECGERLVVAASCGHTNRPGVAFCEECGERIEAETQSEPLSATETEVPVTLATVSGTEAVVAACGHTNRPDVAFCEECGTPLAGPASPVAKQRAHRRVGVAAVALVVLAASVGTGAWYWGRESTTSGSGAAPSGERFTGPPSASPNHVMSVVPAILGSTGVLDPYAGFAVEDEDGTTYIYDDSRWMALTPDGSMWAIPQASASLIEEDGRIAIASSTSDVGWVEDLLADTPGVTRSGSGYVITDEALYRDGVIDVAFEYGILVDDTGLGERKVIKPQQTEVGYVYGEDDHAWIITRDGAGLIIPEGDSMIIAGSIMAGPAGELDIGGFEPRPGYDRSSVRDILMSGKFGTYKTRSSDLTPAARESCRTLEEIYAEAPTDSDRVITVGAGELAEACENQPEAQAASGERTRLQQDWGRVWAERRDDGGGLGCSWWVWDCVVTGVQATPGLLESGYHSTVGQLDNYTICLIGDMTCPDWYWEKVEGLWAEKNCRSVGPGTGENGKGAPMYNTANSYSVSDVAAEAGYSSGETAFAEGRLALARAWMPRLELSNDEQCGEILRVVARVSAYTPGGELAASLAEADRAEIVYTVFYRWDGGRFGREFHAGDNEGFVISLTRRDSSQGMCRGTAFEFYGGRTVAHQDASDWFQSLFHITERHIEDFYPGSPRPGDDSEIATSCPGEEAGGGFFLHVAESKHATYYNRDICEEALAPDSPTVLVGFVLGFAVGSAAGPVGGAAVGALSAVTTQAILNTMPNGMKWQDGLEECEFGRVPYDLSDRIELYDDAFGSDTDEFDLHFSGDPLHDRYDEKEKDRSFGAQVRGVACPESEWATGCQDDDFHVPGFFEASATDPTPTEPDTPVLIAVPNVIGDDAGDARGFLEEAGFRVVVRDRSVDSPSDDGRVVDQSPDPGDRRSEGSTVTVYRGTYSEPEPAVIAAPDVLGQSISSARSEIEGLGLVYGYGGLVSVSNQSLDGVVADQDPAAGSALLEGDRVTVYIGDYVAPLVAVPDLGGLTESAAISAIQSRGLVAQVAGEIETSDSSFFGRVMDQDPMPYGADVPAGSTVRIWIGKQQSISYPSQETSPWITLALQGSGHGTVHSVGETLTFCVSWSQLGGEPPPNWGLISYMTNPAGTYLISGESMIFGGAMCPAVSVTLSGSTGLKQFEVQIIEYSYSQEQWVEKDTADLWIYVTN